MGNGAPTGTAPFASPAQSRQLRRDAGATGRASSKVAREGLRYVLEARDDLIEDAQEIRVAVRICGCAPKPKQERQQGGVAQRTGGVDRKHAHRPARQLAPKWFQHSLISALSKSGQCFSANFIVAVLEPRNQRLSNRGGVDIRHASKSEGRPVSDVVIRIHRQLDESLDGRGGAVWRQTQDDPESHRGVRVALDGQQCADGPRVSQVAQRNADRMQHFRRLFIDEEPEDGVCTPRSKLGPGVPSCARMSTPRPRHFSDGDRIRFAAASKTVASPRRCNVEMASHAPWSSSSPANAAAMSSVRVCSSRKVWSFWLMRFSRGRLTLTRREAA